MKTLRNLLYFLSLAGLMITTSCTDVENIDMEHIGGNNTMGDSEYYATRQPPGIMGVPLLSDGTPIGLLPELTEKDI